MRTSLSHVALLVPSIEASARFLTARGIACRAPEAFEAEGTREIYVGNYGEQSGLPLLVEAAGPGPYARAWEKRGPSLHHVGVDVLDVEEFARAAADAGWSLHPVSARTIPSRQTAWLFAKDVPCLIEAYQQEALAAAPLKVTRIELPTTPRGLELFAAIGLGRIVTGGRELRLTIDGHRFAFSEIALAQ